MGADGGVVYIPLKHPTTERYDRVCSLLQPFWQFLSQSGGASWAEDANWEWQQKNNIGPPHYLLGYYGTDRCDNFDLGDLPELCEETEPDYRGDLYSLTFDELDLECRTSSVPITGRYHEHRLHRLWYKHFHYSSRDDVLKELGALATMNVSMWAKELRSLLNLKAVFREETWT